MSTRNISWGVKAASALGWQPYHLHVWSVLKSGTLNLLEPSGSVQDCTGIALQTPPPTRGGGCLLTNKSCKMGTKLSDWLWNGGAVIIQWSWNRIFMLPEGGSGSSWTKSIMKHTVYETSPLGYQSQLYINLINPTGCVMHHQFNSQQLYVLPTLY